MLCALQVGLLLILLPILAFANDKPHRRSSLARYMGSGQSVLCVSALLRAGPANPERFIPSRKKYHADFLADLHDEIAARNAASAPQTQIPYRQFLRAVVETIRVRYPGYIQNENVEVTRWSDLENVVGFFNFNGAFADVYGPQGGPEGEAVLDLALAHRRQNLQIDHGRDPVRNSFMIVVVESEGRYSFQFRAAYDDYLTTDTVSYYLAMYDAFLSAGLPISITPEVTAMVEAIPR